MEKGVQLKILLTTHFIIDVSHTLEQKKIDNPHTLSSLLISVA